MKKMIFGLLLVVATLFGTQTMGQMTVSQPAVFNQPVTIFSELSLPGLSHPSPAELRVNVVGPVYSTPLMGFSGLFCITNPNGTFTHYAYEFGHFLGIAMNNTTPPDELEKIGNAELERRWVQYHALALEKYKESLQVKACPNPAKDIVTLVCPALSKTEIVFASGYDIMGNEIFSEGFSPGEEIKIGMENLSPGIYLFHIKQGNNLHTVKVVKE